MEDKNRLEYRKYLEEISYELEESYRSKNRLKLILRIYSSLGAIIAVIAILYFILSLYQFDLTMNQRLAIMVAGVGLLLSVMSRLYSEIIREREKEQSVRKKELNKISYFILNWATLERTSYSILEKNYPDISKFGIKKNIRILFDEEIISDREFLNLERALDIRNKIVHGNMTSTNEDLDKYSEQINEAVDKILIWTKKH